MRRLSPEVERAIIEDYRNGASQADVSKIHGCNRTTVLKVMKRNGEPARDMDVATRSYQLRDDFFDVIDTEEKAWTLGFITADGNIGDSDKRGARHRVEVHVHRSDRDCLESMAKALGYTGPILDRKNGVASRLVICCKRLRDGLVKQGVTPRKSIVAQAWSGPDHLMRHYFRGLVDGDGTIYPHPCGWMIGLCGSLSIVSAFADFVAERVGVRLNPKRDKNIFVVKYGGKHNPAKIASLLYGNSTISLNRKRLLAERLYATPLAA